MVPVHQDHKLGAHGPEQVSKMTSATDHTSNSLPSQAQGRLTGQPANDGQYCNTVTFSQGHTDADQVGAVIAKIEGIFEDVTDALVGGRILEIPIRSRGRRRGRADAEAVQSVRFPGRTDQEALKFGRFNT